MSAFCDPDTTTSTPHSSVRRSTPPKLETASTTNAAPVGRTASAIPRTSCTTPVEVSDWVTYTAEAPTAAAPIAAGSSRSPHSRAMCSQLTVWRSHISAQRSPKFPADATTTRSPGDERLSTADSMPAVPDPATTSTSPSV